LSKRFTSKNPSTPQGKKRMIKKERMPPNWNLMSNNVHCELKLYVLLIYDLHLLNEGNVDMCCQETG
jgi:hypothetical protein